MRTEHTGLGVGVEYEHFREGERGSLGKWEAACIKSVDLLIRDLLVDSFSKYDRGALYSQGSDVNEIQPLPHTSRIQTCRIRRSILAQLLSEGMNSFHKVPAKALYYHLRVSTNSKDYSLANTTLFGLFGKYYCKSTYPPCHMYANFVCLNLSALSYLYPYNVPSFKKLSCDSNLLRTSWRQIILQAPSTLGLCTRDKQASHNLIQVFIKMETEAFPVLKHGLCARLMLCSPHLRLSQQVSIPAS